MKGRGALGALLDHLGEVAPFGVEKRGEHPVVDGERVELREPSQHPGVGAFATAVGAHKSVSSMFAR